MKEYPILFKDFLVRKILEGKKTQTRRLGDFHGADRVYWHKGYTHSWKGKPAEPYVGWVAEVFALNGLLLPIKCPYGVPGDRLWVRQAWGVPGDQSVAFERSEREWKRGLWPTDPPTVHCRADFQAAVPWLHMGWRPSIHMPRWASRLTLEIAEVRVQRARDISDEDIRAEGFEWPARDPGGLRGAFAASWNRINAERPGGSWMENPWVWALTFRRLP